jgi:hypothetical protein
MEDYINIQQVKSNILNAVKENFRRDKKIDSVALIIDKNGLLHPIGTLFSNNEEKLATIQFIKDYCIEIEAVALFLINEAWKRKTSRKDWKEQEYKSVSEYEDKEECVMVNFETQLYGETICFDIDRNQNELVNQQSAISEGGNFSNILFKINQN